jgi:hypothetical protein
MTEECQYCKSGMSRAGLNCLETDAFLTDIDSNDPSIAFEAPDGFFHIKVKYCPMCGRKLDNAIMKNIFVKSISTASTVETIANISEEMRSTYTHRTDKIKDIKSRLESLVKEFLKKQFPENQEIIEINYCTTELRTVIRCAQVVIDSKKWIGHEFTIYAETKEIEHYTTNELSNMDAVGKFISTGI